MTTKRAGSPYDLCNFVFADGRGCCMPSVPSLNGYCRSHGTVLNPVPPKNTTQTSSRKLASSRTILPPKTTFTAPCPASSAPSPPTASPPAAPPPSATSPSSSSPPRAKRSPAMTPALFPRCSSNSPATLLTASPTQPPLPPPTLPPNPRPSLPCPPTTAPPDPHAASPSALRFRLSDLFVLCGEKSVRFYLQFRTQRTLRSQRSLR